MDATLFVFNDYSSNSRICLVKGRYGVDLDFNKLFMISGLQKLFLFVIENLY